MYGATEAAARLTYRPPARLSDKLGSIGRPIPGVEIVVLNDNGEEAAPHEVGEHVARGDNISRGYWNRPDETADRFGPLGYRTGDLGYADDEGFLYIVGRRHDMMKVGGIWVSPVEVESTLISHPAVLECAVIEQADQSNLMKPKAFVVLQQSQAPSDELANQLIQYCTEKMAAYKRPRWIVFVDELPAAEE